MPFACFFRCCFLLFFVDDLDFGRRGWAVPSGVQVTWDESGDPPPVARESLRACIPRELRDRLIVAVREVAESPAAVLFAEPVDVEDYPNIIAVPIDLGLILRRLEKVSIIFHLFLYETSTVACVVHFERTAL